MTGIPPAAAEWLRVSLHAWAALAPGDGHRHRQPSIGWPTGDGLLRQLDWHGVLGILHTVFRTWPDWPASEELRVAARQAAEKSAAATALLTHAATTVLRQFAVAGARPVLLKGMGLVARGRVNAAERPMSDIDILVEDAGWDAVHRSMTALGYRRGLVEAPGEAHHWAYTKVGPGGVALTVEVHRRLFQAEAISRVLTDAAARARAVTVGTAPALTLDTTDSLLHSAGHLAMQHAGGERLIWVADVDRLVRAGRREGGEDFAVELWRRALSQGLVGAVADSARAASIWFGTPDLGRPPVPHEAAYRAVRNRAPTGREGAKLWADVRAAPGLARKLRLLAIHAVPSPAYMRSWYGVTTTGLPGAYMRRWLSGLGDIRRHRLRPTAPTEPENWFTGG